jgi:hypothetical protein
MFKDRRSYNPSELTSPKRRTHEEFLKEQFDFIVKQQINRVR